MVKQESLKRLISFSLSSISPQLNSYKAGIATKEETITAIADQVRSYTFTEDDSVNYLFMLDFQGNFIMHPLIPEFEGTNQIDLADADGKLFIKEMVETARTGGGFLRYNYQRPDMSSPEPKITYVAGIDELDCFIGMGIYDSDLQDLATPIRHRMLGFFYLYLIILYFSAYIFIHPIVKSTKFVIRKIENIDLETGIETLMEAPEGFRPNSSAYNIVQRVQELAASFADRNNRLINALQERNRLRDEHIRLMENSLSEKELMLREVNHRVKNNLQIIISLLNMQMLQAENKEIRDSYIETVNRLKSISLIHSMLYSYESYRTVSEKKYLVELIEYIKKSYSSAENIVFEYDIEDDDIETDTAVTLGIITNEAITNSIKYAFDGKQEKRISISLRSSETGNVFIISDNGKGLPDKVLTGNSHSLGLNLIRTLCRQMKAELVIDTEKGTSYKIIFS